MYENEKVTEKEGEAYAKSINAKFLMFSAKCDNEKKLEDFLSKLLKEYLDKEENKKKEEIRLIEKNKIENWKKKNCVK